MRRLLFIFAFISVRLVTQTLASFAGFGCLLGRWNAATIGQGSAGAASLGTYTFQADLGGTVITRKGSADTCQGPARFDCQHHDLLTIY